MNNVLIKPMSEEDIDGVLNIEEKSFTTPWSREAFIMEVKKNNLAKYIVAEANGKIVGYGGMWLIIDEGHITNIAVDPEFRGKGIGNLILDGLVNICKEKGIERITLEVRRSNTVAQGLYRKYGFDDCGIRPGYYTDNKEDAVIMWKEMNW